jgi:hypothetical protein
MSALRVLARVGVLIGVVGSVGLTLHAGRQNPSSDYQTAPDVGKTTIS